MSNGDITIISLVSGPHLIEDIGVSCHPGVLVTIPGAQTLISKDLYRGIAAKALAVVAQPPQTLAKPKASQELTQALADLTQAQSDLSQATKQNEALFARNAFLEQLCSEVQGELATLKARESKLDAILDAVNKPQTVVTQVISSETVTRNALVALPSEEVVGGEAPMFIPSTIKSETMGGEHVGVQEGTSDSGVGAAAKQLRKLRNKQ